MLSNPPCWLSVAIPQFLENLLQKVRICNFLQRANLWYPGNTALRSLQNQDSLGTYKCPWGPVANDWLVQMYKKPGSLSFWVGSTPLGNLFSKAPLGLRLSLELYLKSQPCLANFCSLFCFSYPLTISSGVNCLITCTQILSLGSASGEPA